MRINSTAATALLAVAMGGVCACSPASERPAAAVKTVETAVQPSQNLKDSFPGCQWGKVESATLSVWSYTCPSDHGGVRLAADESLPGFVIESTADGHTDRRPAVIVFAKAADAPVTSILDAVRAKSPGPHTATCELIPALPQAPGGEQAYMLTPTGAVKTAWDRQDSGQGEGEAIDAPCGDLGVQMSGDRSFKALAGDPTKVVFVEYGSEIQIFDADTLKPRPAG